MGGAEVDRALRSAGEAYIANSKNPVICAYYGGALVLSATAVVAPWRRAIARQRGRRLLRRAEVMAASSGYRSDATFEIARIDAFATACDALARQAPREAYDALDKLADLGGDARLDAASRAIFLNLREKASGMREGSDSLPLSPTDV